MADISRLAGVKVATVGNWKIRENNFPQESGKSSRGPLYDRGEVIEWLESKGRIDRNELNIPYEVLRSSHSDEEITFYLLLVAAFRIESTIKEFESFLKMDFEHRLSELKKYLTSFADVDRFIFGNQPSSRQNDEDALEVYLTVIASMDIEQIPSSIERLLNQLPSSKMETRTPRSIKKLIVGIAGNPKEIYNPASGSGGLMIELGRSFPTAKVFAQELNSSAFVESLLRCSIQGVNYDLASGDVFTHDYFSGRKADLVVSNPPFGMRLSEHQVNAIANDSRWIWGVPSSSSGNAAWVQHCISHLSEKGMAILVFPTSAQFEGGISKRVREGIIKSGYLDAVISLPKGLFASTAISSTIFVLSKEKSTSAEGSEKFLMVDLENLDNSAGSSEPISDDVINDVVKSFLSYKKGNQELSQYAKSISYEQIAANDFNISPKRYFSASSNGKSQTELLGNYRSSISKALSALESCNKSDKYISQLLKEDNNG